MVALALMLAACDSTSPTPNRLQLPDGGQDYLYTAYSPAGFPVLTGTIHLEWGVMPLYAPPRGIAGTWDIHWIPGADSTLQLGPQIGSGTMDGVDDSSGVQLAFSTNQVDQWVGLDGHAYGLNVTGEWHYSTIAGPSQHGRFTLVAVR